MNIAFRFDVGENIGYGHFVRCNALADALSKNKECKIFFIIRNDMNVGVKYKIIKLSTEYNINNVDDYVYESIENELNELMHVLKKLSIDCLIVDNYGVTNNYFTRLRKSVKNIIYIDDLCKEKYNVNMIVNGNCYATDLSYDNESINLLGCKYTLMRECFRNCNNRIVNENVKTITITTGGSDPLGMTCKVIEVLKKVKFDSKINVRIIIGKAFNNVFSIKNSIGNLPYFKLIYNSNMKEEMLKSDLFITSSGSTLYELAATGTPSISFILSPDQIMVAEYMNKKEVTINIGNYSDIDNRLSKIVNNVVNSFLLRKKMSNNGLKLIDGLGTDRVAEMIIKMVMNRI
ncbi:UDP-2,4-diacetamido-2,4,6-trideoxy-beta-L-altropyranose hydrolase [Anaerosporobacter faecicola]|uniref:UDP-2,4-diacetamido-2,4, 6-trideoxy-beta-L-altropyranose hydrolase n=1 Tax=Anaerosporobacter faecicola TaxID=2718714 RepID=UPI00143A0A47|nr:UDP-2,4-diacetamido-2,4,6-trideoxy-beta-L-altropyranose hydrolase [Anaerosporobacter faecicola]